VLVLALYYGVPFGLLIAGLNVSQDYRKRWTYSYHTRHLGESELGLALSRNMEVVAVFVQDIRNQKVSARRADEALIMATVLEEHLSVLTGADVPRSYLKRRKRLWNQAAKMDLPDGA
jgi:hypothetical protein